MMYRLKFSIKESESAEINPDVNAVDVKNRTEFFGNDYYDDFIEPEPFFNDMKMYTRFSDDEEPKILNDAHGWAGEYPCDCWSFPVSERLKNIMKTHNLVGSRFYPGTLNFQHKVYPYFVFHTLDNAWAKSIDLEKSIFTEWDAPGFTKISNSEMKISSFVDYSLKTKILRVETKGKFEFIQTLGPDKIHLKEQFDLIYLPKLRYVISERLKQALEKANISGLEYDPITNVDFYYQGEKI